MVSLGATVALGDSYCGNVVTCRRGSRLLSMDARFLAAAPHQHSDELQTSGQWVVRDRVPLEAGGTHARELTFVRRRCCFWVVRGITSSCCILNSSRTLQTSQEDCQLMRS
uniref:Polyketide synthase n=1 Tax=Peronospora matthiolae TaxID=2874970 RepID=A0AAV1UCJ4_9STRA